LGELSRHGLADDLFRRRRSVQAERRFLRDEVQPLRIRFRIIFPEFPQQLASGFEGIS
jgi:hypothetical protein